jgi:glyoxylase I family protein
MNIRSIHHIAILTDDYEKSKRFYTEVLGFEVIRETYRAERKSYKLDLAIGRAFTRSSSSPFRISASGAAIPKQRACATWPFAVDDVEAAAAELRG